MALSDLLARVDEDAVEERSLMGERLTFTEYLGRVKTQHRIAAYAHQRIRDMIIQAGVVEGKDREPNHYKFFENDLYGLDKVFHQLMMEYLVPAAQRLEIRKRILLLVGPVGGGKCLGRGTPVLMYNGDVCPVERISPGDYIMGPDSKPRHVLTTTTGFGPLYMVTPTKGKSYIVNSEHVLSLRHTFWCDRRGNRKGGEIVNIPVNDYVNASHNFKNMYKSWRTGIDFESSENQYDIDPYFLGLWLGNGFSELRTVTVCTPEPEIKQYLFDYASSLGLKVTTHDHNNCTNLTLSTGNGLDLPQSGRNALLNNLRRLGMDEGKHIPSSFLTGSQDTRLKVLAGLIDTDGHYKVGRVGFEISTKFDRLATDILFLCRSLGFAAYDNIELKRCQTGHEGLYHRITISGDVARIPTKVSRKIAPERKQKKSVLVTGIAVEPIGEGEYFGFELDGDGLFVLGDFTVTHNSTLVTLLKQGLETYSYTDDGAVYAIDGCPMYEDPLHVFSTTISRKSGTTARRDAEEELGITIEGDLCPLCQYRLEHDWDGKISNVPVVRVLISEKHRVGIGTYKPSDPKAADVAELTGHINLSLLTDPQYKGESDPRAYRFDGELNVANRGIIEMIEMLKLERQFLYELNTVAGEQRIKVPQFALVYVDLLVLGHCNEHEFKTYFSDPANEAMVDRIHVVKVPYNLCVSDEIRIYKKLVGQGHLVTEMGEPIHIAPQTLKVASMLSVLSRLKPSERAGLSLIAKMKLYDGEQRVGEWEQKHLLEIQQEAEKQHEGMDGFSPRFIINRLATALMKGRACINPIDVIRSLRDGIKMTYADTKEQEILLTLLDEVRKEYDEWVKKRVQRAFVAAYEENATIILQNYISNTEAFCNKTKVHDPITDEEVLPDEKLMQSIEEQIGVTGESKRKEFREGIIRSVASVMIRGNQFVLSSNSTLQEAIEKKLFADLRDVVKITVSTKTPDEEQQKRIDVVLSRLTDETLPDDERFCTQCGQELLKYTGMLLNR